VLVAWAAENLDDSPAARWSARRGEDLKLVTGLTRRGRCGHCAWLLSLATIKLELLGGAHQRWSRVSRSGKHGARQGRLLVVLLLDRMVGMMPSRPTLPPGRWSGRRSDAPRAATST
jgi:hypothetical protein